MYAIEVASYGMVSIPSIMKTAIKATSKLAFHNLRGYNSGIIEGRDF
jgi:hypothetical protein